MRFEAGQRWLDWIDRHRRMIQWVAGGIFLLAVLAYYFIGPANQHQDAAEIAVKTDQAETMQSSAGSPSGGTAGIGAVASETEKEAELIKQAERIAVDIDGAVQKPAVYLLAPGTRVYQGIDAAGGLTEQADTRWLNLAAILIDGSKLYVPAAEPQTAASAHSADTGRKTGSLGASHQSYYAAPNRSPSSSGEKVNLNTADGPELEKLTGVGPAMAEKILRFRETNGPFQKPEDLMKISGIGEKTFAKMKDEVTVE